MIFLKMKLQHELPQIVFLRGEDSLQDEDSLVGIPGLLQFVDVQDRRVLGGYCLGSVGSDVLHNLQMEGSGGGGGLVK